MSDFNLFKAKVRCVAKPPPAGPRRALAHPPRAGDAGSSDALAGAPAATLHVIVVVCAITFVGPRAVAPRRPQ
jgi:hypothetical protein